MIGQIMGGPVLWERKPEGTVTLVGITQRELFAAMMMQGFISGTFTNTGGQCVGFTGWEGKTVGATPQEMASVAVRYADALIAELAKEKK